MIHDPKPRILASRDAATTQRIRGNNKIKVKGLILVASSRRRVKPVFGYRSFGCPIENVFQTTG
jgi:hypothetical protein